LGPILRKEVSVRESLLLILFLFFPQESTNLIHPAVDQDIPSEIHHHTIIHSELNSCGSSGSWLVVTSPDGHEAEDEEN
jgi:hypothetical protein